MPSLLPHQRRFLLLIWALFVVRGTFYCVQQPMWEGFDEWAHFAYIQHLAERGSMPTRTDPVSPLIRSSLQLVPLSRAATVGVSGSITHDAYWKLTPQNRELRQAHLRTLTALDSLAEPGTDVRQYEAQQPPLYYAALVPAYRVLRNLSLPAQVLSLRILNVAIASTVIFVTYAFARLLLPSPAFALLLPLLITSLPGLFINICRIGNESLTVVLAGLLLLAMVKATRGSQMRAWIILGLTLGAVLLTKAYALCFLPLVPITAGLSIARTPSRWQRILAGMLVSLGLACLLAGWWYWRTWLSTGTLSGEQVDMAAGATLTGKLSYLMHVKWATVIDSAAFTHIWIGGWSFLTARAWMYRVCEAIAAIAFTGIVIYLFRYCRFLYKARRPGISGAGILLTLAFFLSLCAALAYHALVVHLAEGIATASGWYLHGAIVAEVLLIAVGFISVFGLRYAQIAVASVCVLACALDLYTTHFLLMPYHSGLRPGANLQRIFAGLAINESPSITPAIVATAWAAYLLATLTLAALALRTVLHLRSQKSLGFG